MLPFDLIRLSAGQQSEVWLKNGKQLKGTLSTVDRYMNLNMKNVLIVSQDGNQVRVKDAFIKGIEISTMNIPEAAMDKAMELETKRVDELERMKLTKQRSCSNGPRNTIGGSRPHGNDTSNGHFPPGRNFRNRHNKPAENQAAGEGETNDLVTSGGGEDVVDESWE